ncbi:MAG TPA: hypothetical protein VJY62_12205 [Bacteroidia bacterium]|nr:hypothetical protein [Bacteroidia bacterium]
MEPAKKENHLNSKFWKMVFLVAGLYTAGGVLPGIINPQKGIMSFTGKETNDFYSIFFFQNLWITVLVFGIGYLIVATKPSKYTGIIIIGLTGKLLFASNVIYNFFNGHLNMMALSAAIVDFVFVILFGIFIYLSQKNLKT